MRTLYTVSYPEVSPESTTFMEDFRREHDLVYRDVAAAHFTLVFGCETLPDAPYLQHVEAVAHASPPIPFVCRYAMLSVDASGETAYIYLVPDEGYAAVSLLHDRLYTGLLEPILRLDVPFVPHITIGTLPDKKLAKALCDELNRNTVGVEGRIRDLTVGGLVDQTFTHLATYPLLG